MKIYYKWKKYDKEIIDILLKREISWDEAIILKNKHISSKRPTTGVCNICNKDFHIRANKLIYRMYSDECVCGKCYIRFVTSTAEWRNKNSKAQLIAQNRPEVIRKNSEGVKRFWKNNPEIKERMRKKLIKLNENEEHQLKILRSKWKGHIETRFGKISFQSRLELAFILKCEKNKNVNKLVRWNKPGVIYSISPTRRYYPDFILNNKSIIECKSNYVLNKRLEEIKLKAIAVKNEYKDCRYSFVIEDDVGYDQYYKKPALYAKRIVNNIFFWDKKMQAEYSEAKCEN